MEALPDPAREILARRVRQTGHLIQIVVVKLVEKGLEGILDAGEVHDPSRVFLHRTADVDFHAERMTVQTAAFVALGGVGQLMRRFNQKNLINHGSENFTQSS